MGKTLESEHLPYRLSYSTKPRISSLRLQIITMIRRLLIVIVAISLYYCQLVCLARNEIGPEFGLPDGEVILSDNQEFELGFFSAKGRLYEGRYVGIWYAFAPANVVWVANRDKPIAGSSGVVRIHEGNLHVFDNKTGKSHWSTDIETAMQSDSTAVLMNTGNLVLGETLWQSFDHPTDTFLPGMEMRTGMKLTSWSGNDDPTNGSFIFRLDDKVKELRYVIMQGIRTYWRSGGGFASSDKIPSLILSMLSASVFKSPSKYRKKGQYSGIVDVKPEYYRARLVMTFNGSIEFLKWDDTRMDWESTWFEPADLCSTYNACGSFGSCNNLNNVSPCKCLPGFKPSDSVRWNSGDFYGGCIPRMIQQCRGAAFLNFSKLNLANPESDSQIATNEMGCRKECLENCKCKAYSFKAESSKLRESRKFEDPSFGSCTAWLEEDLHDIHEETTEGENLFVRVAFSDLELSARNCHPCGTTAIPYPLSIGPGCGDPAYSSIKCNRATGRATFNALNGEYRVLGIDQDTRKILIGIPQLEKNCDVKNSSGRSLQLDKHLPFKVSNWCYTGFGNFISHESNGSKGVVEIEWEAPHEPTCTKDSDCKVWPNSSCRKDGERKRCLCSTHFVWDGHSLNCTQPEDYWSSSHATKNRPLALIIAPVVASIVVLACAFVAFIIWRRKTSKKQGGRRKSDQRISKVLHKLDTENRIKHLMDSGEFAEEDEEAVDVPFFDFESIVAATNDFSDANKLGQGGYGPVYKGTLPGGQEIAVKRLSSASGQGLQEFKNEVVLIANLQHRNLVKLRGYCIKGEEKILLYEYMPNKSLDSLLFASQASQSLSVILDWGKRFNIILGIARGLLYLHQDSRLRIIHRDFKTSNILLNEDMEPKISDFGLARIVGSKQTEAITKQLVGTRGYMSPEYILQGIFSVKSDVFSFGVVLLEIISGKRNARLFQSEPHLSLLGYAWRLWTENKVQDLIDPALTRSCREDQFLKCFKISLLCVQEDPSERPTMSTVLTWLDSETTAIPTPQQPGFVIRQGSNSISSSSSTKPEITVTLEEGR